MDMYTVVFHRDRAMAKFSTGMQDVALPAGLVQHKPNFRAREDLTVDEPAHFDYGLRCFDGLIDSCHWNHR
jgi:hypothetical protein